MADCVSFQTVFYQFVGKQLERRKQEDELKRVMQQEQHFERVKVRVVYCIESARIQALP